MVRWEVLTATTALFYVNNNCTSVLSSLKPATSDEIAKLIKNSAPKSCDIDPIPTLLLKLCQDELLPVITHIVNTSLSCSTVPKQLKLAFIRPLLKKLLLDPEVLKNFRPVSNLSFISKLIERVVADRLGAHMLTNQLYEPLQNDYRHLHSPETAILKVLNDLLKSIDTKGGAILVLLDLSAAFDTIDHKILCQRLEDLGVRDAAAAWFQSYLSDRSQAVGLDWIGFV